LAERFRTVGIDIGGTNIKVATLWSDGVILHATQIPTNASEGPEAALPRLIATIEKLLEQSGMSVQALQTIGVDSAGIIDPHTNRLVDSPNLRSWEGYPLCEALAGHFDVTATLENDVNAMAYGEWRCGAGRGTRHMVALTLGTGVGGGLILDGRLYRGAHGAAAEIGHMTLDLHGAECTCPNRGCFERLLGAAWIVERAIERLGRDTRPSALRGLAPEQIDPRSLSEAADAGDAIAARVLQEVGEILGAGLVSIANIFDPERIVIGGGVANAGDRLFQPAEEVLRRRAMSTQAQHVQLVAAALGDEAALVGASLLAIERQAAQRQGTSGG
jgi:glucokinase